MVPLKHAFRATPTTNTHSNPFTTRRYAAAENTHTELTTAFFGPLSGLGASLKRVFREGIKDIRIVQFSSSTLTPDHLILTDSVAQKAACRQMSPFYYWR